MYNLSFPKEVIIKNNDLSQYMYLGNHINKKRFFILQSIFISTTK